MIKKADVSKLTPEVYDGGYKSWHVGYSDLLPEGTEIVSEQSVGSYQGDYLFLLKDVATGKLGFLCFGYGSCGGCDWLLSVIECRGDEPEDEIRTGLDEIAQRLLDGVLWFESKDEAIKYLKDRDGGNSYWYTDDGGEEAHAELLKAVEAYRWPTNLVENTAW